MTTRPWLAIGLATIAAVCLVGSMFSHRWLVPDYASDDGFSPRSFQFCVYKNEAVVSCQVGGNADVVQEIDRSAGSGSPPSSPLFVPAGTLTWFSAFMAFAALITSSVIAATGRRSVFPIAPTTIATLAIVVGGVGGAMFMAMRPGSSPIVGGPFETGWAAAIFGIGELLGLVSVRQLARAIKPERASTTEPASGSTRSGPNKSGPNKQPKFGQQKSGQPKSGQPKSGQQKNKSGNKTRPRR